MKITKDMLVGEILDKFPELSKFFIEMGMHCLGCPSSRGETIEEACGVHEVDCAEVVERLNEHAGL